MLAYQSIVIKIPLNNKIFEEIQNYTYDENLLMIEIGSHSIKKIKNEMSNLTKDDREKIKGEIEDLYKDKINNLRTLYTYDEEKIKELQEQIINIKSELKTSELIMKTNYEKESNKKIEEMKERLQIEKEILQKEIHNREREMDDKIQEEKGKIRAKMEEIQEEEKIKLRNEYEKKMEEYMQIRVRNLTEHMEFLNQQLRQQLENIQLQQQSEKVIFDQKIKEKEIEYELKCKEDLKKNQIVFESIDELKKQIQQLKELNIKMEEEKKYSNVNMENIINAKISVENQKKYEKIEELNKEKEKLKEEILEKEKQFLLLREKNTEDVCDMLKRTIQEKNVIIEEIKNLSCSKKIGDIGENIFEELANETFGDFDNFKIEKTAGKSHSADFHLHFKNMIILVDSKKYSGKINSKTTNINKIKSELKLYPYIKIAWVVSLDTDIINIQNVKNPHNMNFTPVIEDDVCVIYVNSLMMNEEPSRVLKTVWYISTVLYDNLMNINDKTELLELTTYKKNEIRVKELVEFIQNILREHVIALDKCKEHIATAKQKLKEIINEELKNIVMDDTAIIKEWLEKNIEYYEGSQKIQSLALYKYFIMSKKEEGLEKRITHDKFKIVITTNDLIKRENIIQKTAKSQLEIVNYRMKQIEIKMNI